MSAMSALAERSVDPSVTVKASVHTQSVFLKAEIKPQMKGRDSFILSCVCGPRCQGDKLEWE